MHAPESNRDTTLLFLSRSVRLFAYGFLSVVLVLHLAGIGLSDKRIGLLLSLTLFGDVVVALLLANRADTIGRRRTLLIGAGLMIVSGGAFALTANFWLLALAATVGVISPSGNEAGPFLAVEQVALAESAPARDRTALFAWYNLAGSFATAAGSLAGGMFTGFLIGQGFRAASSYRMAVIAYATLGALLAVVFLLLSPRVETAEQQREGLGFLRLSRSRSIIFRLASLFALDSFAGGLVVQSVLAYWFHLRFGVSPTTLGTIFFGANLLAGVSALAAARIAARFGLVNTMVFTHLPSNILLILIPFMPTLTLAITVLLLRFSISQMDVPTRQSYVIAVVEPHERTAAAGLTGAARSTGAALAPVIAVPLITAAGSHWLPFVAAGVLKVIYDLMLLRGCRSVDLVRDVGAKSAQKIRQSEGM